LSSELPLEKYLPKLQKRSASRRNKRTTKRDLLVFTTPQIEAKKEKRNQRTCPNCKNAGPLEERRGLSNVTCSSLLPMILPAARASFAVMRLFFFQRVGCQT